MVSLSDEDIRSRSFDYNIIKRFMPYVMVYKKDVFLGFFFIMLLTGASLLIPLVVKNLIDKSDCLVGASCQNIDQVKNSILIGLLQFLGLATIGQTLVALLGGLDLSIPFLIGASNVALMSLISKGVPPWLALVAVLLLGLIVGLVNGILSFRLQGQALILTLGVGFFVKGGVQILVAMGTFSAGTVFGVVPDWMRNIASMNGKTVGLPIPPIILIWIIASIIIIVALRLTKWGRNLYALGGSRLSSARLSISERGYWVGAYVISGFFAALTGALLLGWSGGGFIGVGDTYLFLTIAAVVVGGTSLLGGVGGYGLSVIGVLILQIITTVLVGWGLSWQGQQFILGLLIIPMVALYARSPHIRSQI